MIPHTLFTIPAILDATATISLWTEPLFSGFIRLRRPQNVCRQNTVQAAKPMEGSPCRTRHGEPESHRCSKNGVYAQPHVEYFQTQSQQHRSPGPVHHALTQYHLRLYFQHQSWNEQKDRLRRCRRGCFAHHPTYAITKSGQKEQRKYPSIQSISLATKESAHEKVHTKLGNTMYINRHVLGSETKPAPRLSDIMLNIDIPQPLAAPFGANL